MQKAEFSLSWWAMGPKIRPEPKGVVLIIAPFNGPVVMLLSPLVRRDSDFAFLFSLVSARSADELGVGVFLFGGTAGRLARLRAGTRW